MRISDWSSDGCSSDLIQTLGVGEALVSTLGDNAVPGVVEKAMIAPPRSRIGPLSADERKTIMARSPVAGRYAAAVDRESAYDKLNARTAATAAPAPATPTASAGDTSWWEDRKSTRLTSSH